MGIANPSSFVVVGNLAELPQIQDALTQKANAFHHHSLNDIEELENVLVQKASSFHQHEIDNVQGLQIALNDKASSIHQHQIYEISGLQSILNNKAELSHLHQIDEIEILEEALEGKANSYHIHSLNEINGLQNELDLKAQYFHSHNILNIEGLRQELDERNARIASLESRLNVLIQQQFTDSRTPPNNPSKGALWRERDANNLVLGQWFWNGSYWLSLDLFKADYSNLYIPYSQNPTGLALPVYYNIFIERFVVGFEFQGGNINDNSNFWNFVIHSVKGAGATPLLMLSTQAASYYQYQNLTLINNSKIFINVFGQQLNNFSFQAYTTGSPSGLGRFSVTLEYRHAK